MRFPLDFFPDSEQIADAEIFSTNCSDIYSDCGQDDDRLKKFQKFYGKLAEIAVEQALRRDGLEIIRGACLEVYSRDELRRRGFEPDVVYRSEAGEIVNVSVKCCDLNSVRGRGLDWVYQCFPGVRTDGSFFGDKEQEEFLCLYSVDHHKVRIVTKATNFEVHNILTEPDVHYLRGKKKVLRACDLKKKFPRRFGQEDLIYGDPSDSIVQTVLHFPIRN